MEGKYRVVLLLINLIFHRRLIVNNCVVEKNIFKRSLKGKCNGCRFFFNKNFRARFGPDGLSAQKLSAGFLSLAQQFLTIKKDGLNPAKKKMLKCGTKECHVCNKSPKIVGRKLGFKQSLETRLVFYAAEGGTKAGKLDYIIL